MSKIRTTHLNTSDSLVSPEAINNNTDEALEALNGRMGQQNMPVNSVDSDKMKGIEQVVFPTSGVGIDKVGFIGYSTMF